MSKRVLLIEPKFPSLYPGQDLFLLQPSLGLLMLAASLEKQGFEVDLINVKLHSIRKKNIKAYTAVGITGHAIQHKEIVKVAKLVKRLAPDIPIILGGSHATFSAKLILEQVPAIDYIIRHEGEHSFPLLLGNLSDLEAFKATPALIQAIPGLSYRTMAGIAHNPPEPIYNLEGLPSPAFHLLNLKKYFQKIDIASKHYGIDDITLSLGLSASRGCIADCTFCSAKLLHGPKWRSCSPVKLMEDLKLLLKQFKPWESRINIDFVDNTFNASKKWVLEFCHLLRENQLKIAWRCFCRADNVDEELVKTMAHTGCIGVFIGAETANNDSLGKTNKRVVVDSVDFATQLFADHKIAVILSFMIGFPWEEKAHILQSLKTALAYQQLNPMIEGKIFKPTPFPGTPFWEQLTKQGILKTEHRRLDKEPTDAYDISRRKGLTYRHPHLREADIDALIVWFYLKTVVQNIFFLKEEKNRPYCEGIKLRIKLLLEIAGTLGAKSRFENQMMRLGCLADSPNRKELSQLDIELDHIGLS
jgi:radical SAM superfamily enzyme YgiQ (UPF0313 family)